MPARRSGYGQPNIHTTLAEEDEVTICDIGRLQRRPLQPGVSPLTRPLECGFVGSRVRHFASPAHDTNFIQTRRPSVLA
eukprot:352195-Chlamydomonas_euryale.AAC.9